MNDDKVQLVKCEPDLQCLMDEILDVRYTDLDKELVLCKELFRISEEKEDEYGLAFSLTYLGDYYIALNDGQSARGYLEKALKLCQTNHYYELLMNVNIFYGLYYDMMLDHSMSLTCTLDALELATQLNDCFRKSVIINNIANIFENFGDLQAARTYYYEGLKSLENIDQSTKNTAHYALITANLVHISCCFGEVEEASKFLKEFEDMAPDSIESIGQRLVCLCHIAAVKQDLDAIRRHTDELIALSKDFSLWGYQFFEIIMYIVKYLLDFEDREYACKVLMILSELSGDGEPGNQLRVQEYWVKYYELFGTEQQQGLAYKKYYKLKQIIDITNNKTMADGLYAKISLQKAAKQQKEILKENKKLESEAQCDELTGLYNRRSFARLTDRIPEDTTVQSLGLVMIDVDYFKEYNDSYGHAKGDTALQSVAQCMTQAAAVNQDIYYFRYGGDEFLYAYLNCSKADLENLVKTLFEMVRSRNIPHKNSRCSNIVSLSSGFHMGVRDKNGLLDSAELLAQADKALYWSKGRGRNGYCGYTSAMDNVLSRQT